MREPEGNILVVDDSPDIREVLYHLLAEEGYEVRLASSGMEALQAVKASSPDLILLDIMMPGMDGYEVCERLKADEQTCDISVIFISALNKSENTINAFTLGGVDYIPKPFQYEEVLARVKTHLTLRNTRKELEEKNAQLERINAELTREIAERKRAEAKLQYQATRLKVQREVHQSILAAHAPETIAIAAIGRIRQLIPCQRAVATRVTESGSVQILAVESSGEIDPVNIDVYQKMFDGSPLSDRQTIGCNDLISFPRCSPTQEALHAAGVESYVVLPLSVQQELVGSLHLEAVHPEAFTRDHIATAAEVAISLAVAIRQARLYRQAQRERQRADELLLNILPADVAQALKDTGEVKPQRFENVTVCFADIVDFTSLTSRYEPEFVVDELNDLFTAFDNIMEKNQCERIKTDGDAYLAVCGMPEENEHHARNIVKSAIEMTQYLRHRNERSEVKWQMRFGIHSGEVVGGIVGVKKYIYDVFGDAINTASRMQDHSEPMKINVSESTHRIVGEDVNFIEREASEVKGKGKMQMYFVSEGVEGLGNGSKHEGEKKQ